MLLDIVMGSMTLIFLSALCYGLEMCFVKSTKNQDTADENKTVNVSLK